MNVLILFATLVLAANAASLSKLEEKIVGGQLANIEDFPYQVSIQFFRIHTCGGAIISKNKILTAAHCTDELFPTDFQVRAGSSLYNSGGQFVKVSRIEQHPRFNAKSFDYDIAILHLAEDLVFGEGVQPIVVARTEPTVSQKAVVAGWGSLAEDGEDPVHLMSVQVPIIDRDVCNVYYRGGVSDVMICAGYMNGGRDPCQGDSGGPLVSNGRLIGIVSWGRGCARPNYPSVYTNVAKIDDFL